MSIRIIAVGKKHESWICDGIERYERRFKKPLCVAWDILHHSTLTGSEGCQMESRSIFKKLDRLDFVILLDERGENIDSVEFSSLIYSNLERARDITIIIGGAYGVDNSIRERADYILSFSPMVFPHQLVRLMLVEQLYRAQEIFLNKPYHHM